MVARGKNYEEINVACNERHLCDIAGVSENSDLPEAGHTNISIPLYVIVLI